MLFQLSKTKIPFSILNVSDFDVWMHFLISSSSTSQSEKKKLEILKQEFLGRKLMAPDELSVMKVMMSISFWFKYSFVGVSLIFGENRNSPI